MNEIIVKKGSLLPFFEGVLKYDNGDVIDLTDATDVVMNYTKIGLQQPITSVTIEVTNAAAGAIKYQWLANDVIEAGRYRAEFVVTTPTGSPPELVPMKVPTANYVPMIVYSDIS